MTNPFDQGARYAAKLDPPGFFRWHLPGLDPALIFSGWLDTRTLPLPGEPERTCDSVAGFRSSAAAAPPWAIVVEFKTEPQGDMLDQLLEYAARVRRELRPVPGQPGKYFVAGTLVLLTGPSQAGGLDMRPPGATGLRLCLETGPRSLREEDAADTLRRVAAGQLSRCVPPWIPLMRGGAESAIIEQWKQLASAEPDAKRRSDYAALALVFAELTDSRAVWQQALEGWNMRESQQVLEWQAQARAEERVLTRRADLRRVLERRFPGPVPADLAVHLDALTDPEELTRCFDAALDAASLDAFRAAVLPQPSASQANSSQGP